MRTDQTVTPDAGGTRLPSTPTGKDYAALRQEGLEHIQRLAGQQWTDHNLHDPGITLLECLCYALTDVSYRLSFSMEELLALPSTSPQAEEARPRAPLFTARDMLSCHPLTVNDYRQLLLDIPGVRNAWLTKQPGSSPSIYYDKAFHQLSFTHNEGTATPVSLIGVYHVAIAPDDTVTDGQKEHALREKINATLHQHRNIAEDFASVVLLPFEEITVKLRIGVAENRPLEPLMAEIYAALSRAIAPPLARHTLTERRQKNHPVEAIFEGPKLARGFIDEGELASFDRKTTLRSSDFIQILLDIPGIESVKKIELASTRASGVHPWVLTLDPDYTPKLKPLFSLLEQEEIQFERQGIVCRLDAQETQRRFHALRDAGKKAVRSQDMPLPQGRDRHLGDYTSLQQDLPPHYGVGHTGLPDSASPIRHMQARQLKAYLLFFDQWLANYLAQLDHIKELFCPPKIEENTLWSFQTYFTQWVSDVPQLDSLLNQAPAEYQQRLQDAVETLETKTRRGNALLSHLLARLGQSFVDDALLLYDKQTHRQPVIRLGEKSQESHRGFHLEDKLAFLHDYPTLSAQRGSAFDYSQASWETPNISGLKRRLCALLGIKAVTNTEIQDEGFHLVEHLLLRPRSLPETPDRPYWQFWGSSIAGFSGKSPTLITDFSKSESALNRTVVHIPHHGLKTGEHITISDTGNYNGHYEIERIDKDSFHIPKSFVKKEADQGRWSLPDGTFCDSSHHGLQTGDHIIIFNTPHYKGRYEVKWTNENFFLIEKRFAGEETNQGQWAMNICGHDPYSLQLSVVLPDWPVRFQEDNFKKLLYDTLISEVPAHVVMYVHWFNWDKMKKFETEYQSWLTQMANKTSATWPASLKLLELLRMGKAI